MPRKRAAQRSPLLSGGRSSLRAVQPSAVSRLAAKVASGGSVTSVPGAATASR
ncbi:MAG: hypothetical protein U5J97_00675 [Trueperaceae bacterium]|nr:hypothetical protein [Trueperaceae bacterium]